MEFEKFTPKEAATFLRTTLESVVDFPGSDKAARKAAMLAHAALDVLAPKSVSR